MNCSVATCEIPAHSKSARLCSKHYQRMRRHGAPTGGGTEHGAALRWIEASAINFSSRDKCLPWPYGRSTAGYGGMTINGRKCCPHRYICERVHGAPPTLQHVAAHTCAKGHEGCVNPHHLYWATRSQNATDYTRHGSINRGERNGQAKLTEAEAREILAARKTGMLQRELAVEFGVSRELVGRIWRRQVWEWL